MSDQLTADLASLRITDRKPPSRMRGCVLSLAILGGLAWGGFQAYAHYVPTLFKTEVTTTEIISVSPVQASTELTAQGYLIPQHKTSLSAKTRGRIVEMRFPDGMRVKKGEVVFRVDDSVERAALEAAQKRAAAARARLETAVEALAQAKMRFDRETTLVQYHVSPRTNVQDREAERRTLDAAARAAKEDFAAADDDVRAREVDLAATVVVAPYDAAVTGNTLEPGDVTGPGEPPAVQIYDPESLTAAIDVPEKRVERVQIGMPVEVSFEAYPDKPFRGVVQDVATMINRSKGTAMVWVTLVDKPARLFWDMRVTASFLTQKVDEKVLKEAPKIVVPRSAVVKRDAADVVFEIDEGRARMVAVTLGPEFGFGYELRSGPRVGSKLISEPPPTLADGQPVKEKSR